MKNHLSTFITLLSVAIAANLASAPLWAGGGWVANGLNSQTTTLNGGDSSEENFSLPHTRNYFLLDKGEASLALGIFWEPQVQSETVNVNNLPMQKTKTVYESDPGIFFSYGLSKDWTWSNYLSLRYNIYAGDHTDLALAFGPSERGLGYDDIHGFFMAPGASLLHSYNFGDGYRMVNRLSVSGFYQSHGDTKGRHLNFDVSDLEISLAKTFADTFTLSLSGTSYLGYRREIVDGRIHRKWKAYALGAEPTVHSSVALGKKSELGLDIAFPHAALTSRDGPTTVLYLETRF